MSKIKKEELEKLQEANNKLNAVKHDLGLLETQKHSLLHLYADEVNKLEELKKELEDSYGKINIDLKDGSYEEIKEEDNK
jgi:vacuolar-type H+-ATPase subunit I/STV1